MKWSLKAIILKVFPINKHFTIYDGQVIIINGQLGSGGGGRKRVI